MTGKDASLKVAFTTVNQSAHIVSVPDALVRHLLLEGEEEVCEPLKGIGFRTNPVEVHLFQLQRCIFIGQLVEDGFQDGGEWGHSNASPHKQTDLVCKHVFTCRPKWTIYSNPVCVCVYGGGQGMCAVEPFHFGPLVGPTKFTGVPLG